MSNEVKCAHCGGNILGHIKISFISCLSALSGEIEVYRKNTDKEKGSGENAR